MLRQERGKGARKLFTWQGVGIGGVLRMKVGLTAEWEARCSAPCSICLFPLRVSILCKAPWSDIEMFCPLQFASWKATCPGNIISVEVGDDDPTRDTTPGVSDPGAAERLFRATVSLAWNRY